MNEITFKTPSEEEFSTICRLIDEYELDNRDLLINEFTAVYKNGKLAGFGRLKKHNDCIELCSIGILKAHRNSGIGNELIKFMLQQTKEPIYVVCIIPDYFKRFGLKETSQLPECIQSKMNYCSSELPVPEKYTAMVLER